MEKSTNTPPAQYADLQQIRSTLSDGSAKRPSRLWFIVGGVAIVILIIGAVIQALTPKTVPIPETSFVRTNVNNTVSNLRKVTYTGPTPDFPTQFSIFSTQTVLSESDVIQKLSAKYGLLRPAPEANFWVNEGLSLVFDPTTKTYTLTLKDPSNETLPVVNETKAEEVASAYLKETFPEIQLRPMMDQATFFMLSIEPEDPEDPNFQPSKDKATAITIPYTAVLDSENIPVVFEKANQPLFLITIDGNNTVRTVSFSPQFAQYTKVGTKAPISIDDALNQIQQGVASIIYATIPNLNQVKMSDLTSATFTNVNLEYRLDPQSELLYPFYRFSGKATTANDIEADVQVITPAVKITPQTR